MRKRLLATLLVLCVAVAMLPGKALAGEQTVVYASTTAELLKAVSNPAAKSKEALIKSPCADLRQEFSLTRKESAGILTDFKLF